MDSPVQRSRRGGCLLMAVLLGCTWADAGEVVVPRAVRASSSQGVGGDKPVWHVDTLRLGAARFDARTGSNGSFGLIGYPGCVPADQARFPGHDWYREEAKGLVKPRGMWMTAEGEHKDAWLEFELPAVTELSELWIWNWNDGPEIGRRVKQLRLRTSTVTTTPGKLGQVDYEDGVREQIVFPDIGQVQGRRPDVVFRFPSGTRSRYVRLENINNFGPDQSLGLAEVFILKPSSGGDQEVSRQIEAATDPRQEPHWHLFLDNHSITRSTGFRRVLHHPRKRGVVLKADKPWETFGVTPMYVGRRADGTYECYYQTLWRNRGGGYHNTMAYAVSKDGLNWQKPSLGLVDAPTTIHAHPRLPLGVSSGTGKKNNLVPTGHPRDLVLHGNVTDRSKRFAMTDSFRVGAPLVFAAETPDFVGDPDWRKTLKPTGGMKPSHYNALEFWDDTSKEWVYMRQAPNHPPIRCAGRYASKDLKNWTLNHYFYPDCDDSSDPRSFDEVYGLMSIHVEGMVLGFVEWFKGDRTHSNAQLYEDGHNRPTTAEGLIGKSVSKGTMELRLATSHDGGRSWDRSVSRRPWIRHGTEQDSEDRMVRIVCPPLRKGDEDWFYCSQYNGDHATGSGYYHDRDGSKIEGVLYTQKHNRYVSLQAHNVPQILITKPVRVTGKRLQLNVDASRGRVMVGVGIDKVIPHKQGNWPFRATLPHYMVKDRWERSHLEKGFGVTDCVEIRSNCIEHDVQFKQATLESLMGKTVRLFIVVQDADLYGFRFK